MLLTVDKTQNVLYYNWFRADYYDEDNPRESENKLVLVLPVKEIPYCTIRLLLIFSSKRKTQKIKDTFSIFTDSDLASCVYEEI